MIKAHKHLNLDLCLLRVSSKILKKIYSTRIESLPLLLEYVKKTVSLDADVQFVSALNLLYLMGCIDYHPHNDTLEYLDPKRRHK